MRDYSNWRTLREIDAAAGVPKGSAFRRFRALEERLEAGRDYRVLHHLDDREAITALRLAGRIYRSSVNVVLLGDTAARQLVEALRQAPSTER